MESKSHQVSNQDKDSQQEVERTFKDYIKPGSLSKIMGNRKMIFGFYALAGYLGQFFLVVSAINLYSDGDRGVRCGSYAKGGENEFHPDRMAVSSVYDLSLLLLAIYHIIEWVRFTILLTCMFIGVNLLHVWYFLGLNTIYGIAAYICCHVQRFSSDGYDCADA